MRHVTGLFLIAVFTLLLSFWAQADTAWQPQALPFVPEPGSGLGFALDSSGSAAFTYRRSTGTSGLYYGYESAGGWTSDLIDSGAGTGAGSSLTFGGLTPHISYAADHTTAMGLNYATGAPGGWSTSVLAADSGAPRHTAISLDQGGNPAVAWIDQHDTGRTDDTLDYVYFDGSDWTAFENIAAQPRVMGGVELLLPTTADQARVLYSDDSGTFLLSPKPPVDAQRSAGGGWTTDVGLGGTASSAYAAYIAGVLDDSGNPALCYLDTWNSGDIVYAEFDGTDWQIETVVDIALQSSYGDRNYIDIARDDFGHLHLLYFNPDTGQVQYRYRDSHNDVWSGGIVIDDAEASWLRVAVDDEQAPQFAYLDDDDDLIYHGRGEAVPEPGTLALLLIGTVVLTRRMRRDRMGAS